jgi:hypothetical protein
VALVKAQEVAPWGLKAPALQGAQAASEGAPAAAEYRPASQGTQAVLSAAPTVAL